jgi:transposase
MDTRSQEASIGMRDLVVSGDIVKVLWFDGDGLCLLAKRLERGRFVWPQATSGTVSLSRAQLSMLLEGIDWRAPIRTAQPVLSV